MNITQWEYFAHFMIWWFTNQKRYLTQFLCWTFIIFTKKRFFFVVVGFFFGARYYYSTNVYDRRAATAWRHVICFCWTGCTELARYIALFCTSYACGYVSTFIYYVVFISTLQYRSLIIIYWCNVRLVIKQCTLHIACWCFCFN